MDGEGFTMVYAASEVANDLAKRRMGFLRRQFKKINFDWVLRLSGVLLLCVGGIVWALAEPVSFATYHIAYMSQIAAIWAAAEVTRYFAVRTLKRRAHRVRADRRNNRTR